MTATRVPSAAARQVLPRPVAGLIWALAVGSPGLVAIGLALMPQSGPDAWAPPVFTLVAATWAITGALVATRRPGNSVGWLLWSTGTAICVSLLGQGYAVASFQFFDGELPLTTGGAWLGMLFNPALALGILLLPLRFPDGEIPSPRWRIVDLAAWGVFAAMLVGQAIQPGVLDMGFVRNPTGVEALAGVGTALVDGANMSILVLVPLVLLSLVLRFRRGTAVERQQLKWFGGAISLTGATIVLATVLPQPLSFVAFVGFSVSLGLVPVAIGIAVLRYRLFDIDRVIGRTVAYAIVTALLAAAFLGTNLALQAVLADATGSSTLTTAISTLVIAALFQPVRRRVQRIVDRRFNRARVDGERIVDGFGSHARDQVDLERLRHAMVAAVDEAVAPSASGVWLRGERGA